MVLKRVIPCLDVDAGRVVKVTDFVNLRDAGDPVELAAYYDAEGADEVVFLDITATHEKRDTVAELARRTADDVFVPFTIGGGDPRRGGRSCGARRRRRQGGGQPGRGGGPGAAQRARRRVRGPVRRACHRRQAAPRRARLGRIRRWRPPP